MAPWQNYRSSEGQSEGIFVSDDRLSKSDLNCFLCRVCDLRTGGENFLQDNLSNFLNIFPSVKTQEKENIFMLIIHFVCESKWQNHDIFFFSWQFFSKIFFSTIVKHLVKLVRVNFLSFLVRLNCGSVFVLQSSLKLTLFQSKFPLQKCSPFQSVSHLKNIFCLW